MSVLIKNLSVSFPGANPSDKELILDNVSLKFEDGEFVCLLGPSGCGKSTLLGLIAGFVKASHGEILVKDKKVTRPDLNRTLVFQEYALFPWLNVIDNVCFGLEKQIKDKQERYMLAARYLKMVGLIDSARLNVSQLSGGMKQRVAIARALVVKPDLLLMDEPFAALDSQTRELMRSELVRIWTEVNEESTDLSGNASKQGVVFVTHSVDEALILADRIIVMGAKDSRKTAKIPKGEVIADIRINQARPRSLHDKDLEIYREEILKILSSSSPAKTIDVGL